MTIQGRILTGHLAVACMLVIPTIGSTWYLAQVAERTQQQLNTGMQRLSALDQFRGEFESKLDKIAKMTGFANALADPDYAAGAAIALQGLRKNWQDARPQFIELNLEGQAAYFDGLLSRQIEPPPVAANGATGQPEADTPIPEVWSEFEVAEAKSKLDTIYHEAFVRLLQETDKAEADGRGAIKASLAALAIAVLLAAVSTFLIVRSVRRPLRRLASATMAVSTGKYGILVPVRGGGDDLSRLTEAFNRMSENLALFEKLKADFLSIAAHELRTPLTCIKGYVMALRASLPEGPAGGADPGRWLDRIDREADLMTAQVSELLTLGMIEAGQLRLERREIPTEGFLVMACEAFKPIAAERRIEFRTDLQGLPATFDGDQDRLNQVLMNLLDNAFKYTPAGGRVLLAARAGEGMIEIEVSDTCPGIPADQLTVIFEKYARVRPGGTGDRRGPGSAWRSRRGS